MQRIAVVAGHGTNAFELAVACEVFGLDRSDLGVEWYDFIVCAIDDPPVEIVGGFTLHTPNTLADLARADTIIVPGCADRENVDSELVAALQAADRRGARLVSYCTGVFALAAAGVLEGRRATTHWMHSGELSDRFPAVEVDRKVLYVDDDGRVMTSAGTAAAIDLSLHIVRGDFGAEIANAVARRMVVPPHRDGGQAQYVAAPVPNDPAGDGLGEVLDWLVDNLDAPTTVDEMAIRARMSPRTFARRFRDATGTTPLQWLLDQRVAHAKRLLESTDVPIDHVASACGFGSAATLRMHFQRSVTISPSQYRRAFRARLSA